MNVAEKHATLAMTLEKTDPEQHAMDFSKQCRAYVSENFLSKGWLLTGDPTVSLLEENPSLVFRMERIT